MGKVRNSTKSEFGSIARSPEARENEMISLAMDRAEEQLRAGTASSQVITHFLKLAAVKEKSQIELETLQAQRDLYKAKVEAINAEKESQVDYGLVIKSIKEYQGVQDEDDEGYEDIF